MNVLKQQHQHLLAGATLASQAIRYKKLLTLSEIPVTDMGNTTVITGWRRESAKTRLVKLFLRPHLTEKKKIVDNFMKETQKKKQRMYVTGPPGSGKTTFFLAYFTQWARKHKKHGLIVQYREVGLSEIIILRGDEDPKYVVSGTLNSHTLRDHVSAVAKSFSYDFCLLDGVRMNVDDCRALLSTVIPLFIERKLVSITSLEFDIKGGDGTYQFDERLSVDSWEYEDYEASYRYDLFSKEKWLGLLTCGDDFEEEGGEVAAAGGDERMEDVQSGGDDNSSNGQVQVVKPQNENDQEYAETTCGDEMEVVEEDGMHGSDEETERALILTLLERKFFYAGGSARYMLEYTMEDLRGKGGVLLELENRVPQQEWESYASLTINSRTATSVSSLLQKIGGRVFPVSKYFLLIAYEKCKGKLVRALKSAAELAGNPAMKGWAFEIEQLDILSDQMASSKFVVNGNGMIALPVTDKAVIYDGCNLTGNTSRDCFVIKCSKWNQGCFDSAFFFDNHLVTANFTISDSHSVKVRYISMLKVALESLEKEIKSVTHLGIIPDEATCRRFNFESPEDAGYDNGNRLFKLNLARGTKFETPHPSRQLDKLKPRLGSALDSIEIFSSRQSPRKRYKLNPMI